MRLQEYQARIAEIVASELSVSEKDVALALLVREIDGALWAPWARAEAKATARLARAHISSTHSETGLEGLAGLARRGLLQPA